MRERDLERYTTTVIKSNGGLALKFISPGYAGVPDRLVLMPGGKMCFVELKAPGGEPRPWAKRRILLRGSNAVKVYVVDRKEEIGGIINAL